MKINTKRTGKWVRRLLGGGDVDRKPGWAEGVQEAGFILGLVFTLLFKEIHGF